MDDGDDNADDDKVVLIRPLFFPVQRAQFCHHYTTRHKTLLRSFEYKKDLSALDLVWRFRRYRLMDFWQTAYHPPYYPHQIPSLCIPSATFPLATSHLLRPSVEVSSMLLLKSIPSYVGIQYDW